MSRYLKGKIYKRFNRFIASVVLGNAGISMTILVFSVCAILLLANVTAQIYSSILSERITALEKEQLALRERMHTLTSEYTSLASRERITGYCEKILGMVEANSDNLRRIAVETGETSYPEFGEFTVRRSFVPEVLGRPSRVTSKRE